MIELSADLFSIYQLEVDLGNAVARIDKDGWSDCLYSVVFRHPLHLGEIREQLALPPSVTYWECHDSHYELQAGFYSEDSKQSVAGPLP